MLKKIIVVLVLLLAVVNSTSKDNIEKETGKIIIATAGFSRPNGRPMYHIPPQSCTVVERNNNWVYIQLQDGTSAYVPSDVLK